MGYIYFDETTINKENEKGRIESVKHIEWLLIFLFLFFTLTRQIITFEIFIVYIIGAQIPDLLEGIFFKLDIDPKKRRLVSHTFVIPIFIIIFSYSTYPLLFYFSLSYFGHLIIDLFAGGDPVYLIGPFRKKFGGNIMKKEKRLQIGEYVYNKVGYFWQDQTDGDLAWFWILQFFGSVFSAIAFSIYLSTII